MWEYLPPRTWFFSIYLCRITWWNIVVLKLCWFSDNFWTQLPAPSSLGLDIPCEWWWVKSISTGSSNSILLRLSQSFSLLSTNYETRRQVMGDSGSHETKSWTRSYLPFHLAEASVLLCSSESCDTRGPYNYPGHLPQRKTWKLVWHTIFTRFFLIMGFFSDNKNNIHFIWIV